MPAYSPVVAILQGFPEAMAMVFLVFAILGTGVRPGPLLLLSVLFIAGTFVVRYAEAPFPAHTLLMMVVVMPVLTSLWERIRLQQTVLAWACTLLIVMILETVCSFALFGLIDLSVEELLARPVLWALTGWPHIILTVLLALWVRRRGGIRFLKVHNPAGI